MDSVTWRVCDSCGRELPITMYALDPSTGHPRATCKRCMHRARCRDWHARYRKGDETPPTKRGIQWLTWRHVLNGGNPHPGSEAVWTEEDRQSIEAGIGRRAEDVAREIGRSTPALKAYLWSHMDWLRIDHGVIIRRNAVESQKSA